MLRDPPWYVLFPIAGEGTEEAAAPGSAELLWVQGAGNTPKLAVPIQGSQHRFIFVNSQESLALWFEFCGVCCAMSSVLQ